MNEALQLSLPRALRSNRALRVWLRAWVAELPREAIARLRGDRGCGAR